MPEGFGPAGSEMVKRRRILDAVNHVLVHGGRIDMVGFQAHLDPRRAVDAADLATTLASLRAMGVGAEVTELDVAPHPLAVPYAEAWLSLALTHSPMARVGGWTGWAPPGEPRRLTMLDRTGVAPLGHAVARALGRAAAPEARPRPPASRRYGLTHGVTADLWRAARDGEAPGFEPEGTAAGTRVRPGSGGAALPLTNAGARPGGPVAPVWWDGRLRDHDPAAMAMAFQWEAGGPDGPRLALTVGGRRVLEASVERRGIVVVRAGLRELPLAPEPPGFARLALSWEGDRVRLAVPNGPVAGLPLAAPPDALILLGDGHSDGHARATMAEIWRDPADDAALTARARPEGARFLTLDDLAKGAP